MCFAINPFQHTPATQTNLHQQQPCRLLLNGKKLLLRTMHPRCSILFCRAPSTFIFPLCPLCPFSFMCFVNFVVEFYHEGHKGHKVENTSYWQGRVYQELFRLYSTISLAAHGYNLLYSPYAFSICGTVTAPS
jgi:hypothetical protein